jgi:hypothetical protein
MAAVRWTIQIGIIFDLEARIERTFELLPILRRGRLMPAISGDGF